MTTKEYLKAKEKARRNVDAMDNIDGFKDRDLQTICVALQLGLERPETNAHFEALVMLEDLIAQTR